MNQENYDKQMTERKDEVKFIEDMYGISVIDFETGLTPLHYLSAMKEYADSKVNLSHVSLVIGSWVSVKDRLPDRDTKCLVYRSIGLIDVEYFYFESKSFSGDYQPTHYMPLPPKPINA